MLVGATHIDHVGRLRAGATAGVLGFRPAAASTVGSFLRSFTWGHVRQLDKAAGEVLGRAWAAGGGPGNSAMTIDVDSTVCEVSGKAKAGAAYGHTKQLCYHPLVGVRAESGEILATRLRKGSSQSGSVHFVAETVARARRAGAGGELTLRADSGFFSYDLLDRLDALKVRRSRLGDPQQAALWPDWRYHAFVTNRTDLDTIAADKYHRAHATVELATGDLKNSTGLAHLPSGSFAANAAWLACAALAHNLYRWINHHTPKTPPNPPPSVDSG